MAQFNNGESGASVRTKINASIATTDQITDVGSGEIITTTERSKLNGIEDGADANFIIQYGMGIIDTNAVTLTLNSNGGIGTFAFVRTGVGTYQMTLVTPAWIIGRTLMSITSDAPCFVATEVLSTDQIEVRTYDTSGVLADNLLTNAAFEIKTYKA